LNCKQLIDVLDVNIVLGAGDGDDNSVQHVSFTYSDNLYTTAAETANVTSLPVENDVELTSSPGTSHVRRSQRQQLACQHEVRIYTHTLTFRYIQQTLKQK